MHLSEITEQIAESMLLLEANVLNVKELYNDTSIAAFLKQYAQGIGNQEVATGFVKKLTKLLLNDDRWHHAVRELPNNAPDWAKEAHQKRELVFFKPDEPLGDKVAHISHYLAAVVEDIKPGPDGEVRDNNKKVHAEREIAGFPKIGDLETIVKKSDEYFARGNRGEKKTGASVEGMQELEDVGHGDRWYLLQTQDAYRREGKTLQNCIGSHWTLSKAKSQGYSIVIMRKANDESVVAARIKNDTNEIAEMKGKNNRAPVDKYMGGVLRLIRKRKLKVGSSAQYDFKRAGYFSIDGGLYSRAEAMKKFITSKDIATVGDKQLVEIGYIPAMEDILGTAYPEFKKALRGKGRDTTSFKIYELRDGTGHATLSTLVSSDKEVIAVNRAKKQIAESVLTEDTNTAKSDEAKALFKKLFDLKLIEEIGGDVQQDMFWGERVQFDREGNIVPVEHDKVKHHDGGHTWEHYTNPQTAKTMKNAAAGGGNDYQTPAAYKEGKNKGDPHSVYMTQRTNHSGEDENIIAVRTKDGNLIPGGLEKGYNGTMQPKKHISHSDGHHGGGGKKDKKTVDSIMSLANKEGLELPRAFKHSNGILKDKKGQHVYHEPKAKDLGDGATLYDVSKLDAEDRMVAIRSIITSGKIRKNHPGEGREHHDVHQHDVHSEARGNYGNPHKIDDESGEGNNDMTPTGGYRKDTVPTALYTLDVKYGGDKKHRMVLQVHDKMITEVDSTTAQHDFQHWDDYDKVAAQVNKFAEKHGLTFMRKNLLGAAKSKELRVDKGRMTTGTGLAGERHDRMLARGDAGLEGTDSLPLEGGATVTRLTPDEQSKWLRQDIQINSTPGQGWVVKKANGDVETAFFVKKGVIVSIFTGNYRDRENPKAMPASRGVGGGAALSHIKAAAKAFDWTLKPSMNTNLDRSFREQTYRLQNTIRTGKAGTMKDSSVDRVYNKLAARGLIQTSRGNGSRMEHRPTEKGKRYAASIQRHGTAGHWDAVEHTELKKDYVVPDKKEKPQPVVRPATGGGGGAAPRTGTKAHQALALFQQMTTDNDRIPTRAEFMALMREAPYGMGKAGASTYYANTKKKYAALNETYSGLALIQLMTEGLSFLEDVLSNEWFEEMGR